MDHKGPPLWQRNGLSWSPYRSDILSLLHKATVDECRLIPRGSNYTFLVTLSGADSGRSAAVYKPRSGEAPLYDFPDNTLYKREYAAYLVSQALGWNMVPPTIIRDGPHGVGSVQLFIEADQRVHYFVFKDRQLAEVKKIAAFDFVTNNADRKAGHCLEDYDGKIWLIDNGLTFNAAPKLRTVVWDFQGEEVPAEVVTDLERLRRKLSGMGGLRTRLSSLLSQSEMKALQKRLDTLILTPEFPRPGYHRSVPWPPI